MGYHFSSRCCYLLLVMCALHSIFRSSSGCFVEERAALMVISSWFKSVQSEVPNSWGHVDDCCLWERIKCNNSTQRISHIYLSSVYRSIPTYGDDGSVSSASMPVECWNLNMTIFSPFHEIQLLDFSSNFACLQHFEGLQGLSKLRYLNLSDNTLIGGIPGSFNKLVSLEVINLVSNNVIGPLPNTAFRNLKYLREIHLRSNQLSGSLPASLFVLPHLEYVDLSENLFQGHVPINSSWNCSSEFRTLKLSGNKLSGKFDFFWLRNCTKLETVYLSRNADLVVLMKSYGWVPQFQLKALMLSSCNLDKSIISEPHFLGTQRHLQILDLSNNKLPGSMPNWLFTNEETLVYLDLSYNLLVGSLNPVFSHKQSNLQLLNISMNNVVGQLPANFSSVFPILRILDISHNIISGVIPPSLCNIGSIEVVDLSNNNFTGEVPSCLFTDSSSLQILKISNNNLRGAIFGGASNLSSLAAIYLDNNILDGNLPRNISGRLQVMDLHNNKLSGELDTSFWNLPLLGALSLANNSLTGEIRPRICILASLQLLDLSDNHFAGPIPNCSSTSILQFLDMSGNSLSGFPNAFFNSSYITDLDLSYNQFAGNLEWTRHLSEIRLLFLGNNKYEGQIPTKICDLQHLSIIDISQNRLSGSVPSCLGDIPFEDPGDHLSFWPTMYGDIFGGGFDGTDLDDPDLTFMYVIHYDQQGFVFTTKRNAYTYGPNFFMSMSGIDLSANLLSGQIPQELGNLNHIKSLNLSNNLFTGPIPASFANMSEIESLDLSENKLNGSIPWQLAGLTSLEVFSVAYNSLSGCVPDTGQFGSFDKDNYKGNENLRTCSTSSGPMPPTHTAEKLSEDSDPVLYVVTTASFVMTLWATVAFLLCHSFGQRVIVKL